MHKAVRYAVTGFLVIWLSTQAATVCACPENPALWTKVERKFLANSGRQPAYPHEYIPVIETRNQYELGKLAALRFIEWVQDNPRGVVSLTSGNTPEFFIKFVDYYKKHWHKPEVQVELSRYGINLKDFPDTSNLKFVQIEEYYPISPRHYKNVTNYVQRHYVKLLNLKKENVLLMDLAGKGIVAEKGMKVVFMNGKIDMSLVHRNPNSQLESWQQQAIKEAREFCADYEKRIQAWGGIDFFIGSLGYSGHLGYNEPGGSMNSKTHLVKLDYRSAAHAAKDLGGIEHARGKVAVTIGLGTITIKPKAVLIILAAGEIKAPMVRDAVEQPYNPEYPATKLQKYVNSRFYVTASAAKLLNNRRTEDIKINSKYGWTQKLIEEVIIEIAQAENKSITSLTAADLLRYERGRLLLESPPKPLPAMLNDVRSSLIRNLESGLKLGLTKAHKILHTGPHHDDIMLGYYPLMDSLSQKYQNHFAYVTSGFNSVSDIYLLTALNRASDWWLNKEEATIFTKPREQLINKFRNYFVKQDVEQMGLLDTTILLKNLVAIYDLKNLAQLKQTIRWLKDDYFPSKQPGDMDVADIKMLKSMMRESEAERLWTLKNIPLQSITHLRSKFYSGREFGKTPRPDTDITPFIKLYNDYKPDIITVADDPQSAPPVTHYKALQIIAQALRSKDALQKNNLKIWGYRNIWFRYRVQEANIFVPVSEPMLEAQKRAFLACFNTQKSATFPSPFFEGDFSSITVKIQKQQLADLKVLLGADYFAKNSIPELKNAAGIVFLNQMNLDEFFQRVEDLQQSVELEKSFEAAGTTER